jgi:cobalamin synthase
MSLWAMGFKGILVFMGVSLFSLGYRSFFIKKLGGVTGDILGGANELSEFFSLLLMAVFDVTRT